MSREFDHEFCVTLTEILRITFANMSDRCTTFVPLCNSSLSCPVQCSVPPFWYYYFLFICITCVTYNQNLEITALFTDLNISLFLYCRVHRDLPVCLSVGGGHTSNDYECGIYGLCQECVSDSMYITWFVDRQCCVMTVWYVTFSTMSQFPWQLVAHSEDDCRLVSTFL